MSTILNVKCAIIILKKMYLDTQLKAICTKFFEDLKKTDNEQNQIYYTVLCFINSAPHLSNLYLQWTDLETYEKYVLNTQIKPSLPRCGKIIYPPVIRAFEYWDMVQDTYGAPGFSCNPLKTDLSEETDKNIVRMMLVMERIIDQIHNKRKVMKELLSYGESHKILSSYKWRIICKFFNRKRSHLTNTKDQSKKDEQKGEEEVSDLNGCGDTTWYSDID